jgi:hypothetical protein
LFICHPFFAEAATRPSQTRAIGIYTLDATYATLFPFVFIPSPPRSPNHPYVADHTLNPRRRYTSVIVSSYWPALFGFFFGFAFGVGCALAVMYSIYMGGYRAAIRDSLLPTPPESYTKAVAKATHRD